ncbi:MAG: hypothetical protein C3F13_17170 [Anaerolineales bacterium]|nr:MAG: hypothetical protein C3F13_17170 [Anaerolineales bacterium]
MLVLNLWLQYHHHCSGFYVCFQLPYRAPAGCDRSCYRSHPLYAVGGRQPCCPPSSLPGGAHSDRSSAWSPANGVNSLAFAAAILAIATPTIIWDVSFQLSFAATLGIMLYAQPLTQWFTQLAERFTGQATARRLAGLVGGYLLVTLAAQITTLPLMAYYFKRVSLTSLLANLLILPAQPALMILAGVSILAGLVFHPFGQLLAWAAWPLATYSIRLVESFSGVPHGSIAIASVALPLILVFYIFLFVITFFHNRLGPFTKRSLPALPLAVLIVTTLLVWKAAFSAPDGRVHVTIFDVGTGEGVLVRSPTGREILINGGASTIELSADLGRRLPAFNRSLDWLVVADSDDEDLRGISGNLERFHPAQVLWSGNADATRSTNDLQAAISSLSIPILSAQSGLALDLGSGACLKVISANARGAILLLEWKDFRMLLPMGLDLSALESLSTDVSMRNASALLLPESGYAPLNPPELIASLHPQLAVLSVGAGDKSGLPSPETIEALRGYNLLRTDQNGWIEITTDGQQMWIEVERK